MGTEFTGENSIFDFYSYSSSINGVGDGIARASAIRSKMNRVADLLRYFDSISSTSPSCCCHCWATPSANQPARHSAESARGTGLWIIPKWNYKTSAACFDSYSIRRPCLGQPAIPWPCPLLLINAVRDYRRTCVFTSDRIITFVSITVSERRRKGSNGELKILMVNFAIYPTVDVIVSSGGWST